MYAIIVYSYLFYMRRLEIVTDDTDTTRGTEKGNDDAISEIGRAHV